MKRVLSFVIMLALSASVFAQKSYVHILYHDGAKQVTGNVPSGVESLYNYSFSIGDLLNLLSEKGFEVESVTTYGDGGVGYIMSEKTTKDANAERKSYVHMGVQYNVYSLPVRVQISLSGTVPSGIKKTYYQDSDMTIGEMLNLLSEEGFEIEFTTSSPVNGYGGAYFVWSKKSSNTNSVNKVRTDDDSDVHEVARYNLQGMPISENEKGFQVVVYSNYTAKTVIIE